MQKPHPALFLLVLLLALTACSPAGAPNPTLVAAATSLEETLTTQGGASAANSASATPQPVLTATPTARQQQPVSAPATQTLAAAPTATHQATPTQPPSPMPTLPPSPTPTLAAASPTAAAQTPACIDKAAYYSDVTIPDGTVFNRGDKMTKTWQVKNEGTCIWDGYSLIFASGEYMSGPLNNPIPVVQPGDIADITIDLVAPDRSGDHFGNWEFQNKAGQRFGVGSGGNDLIWIKIVVNWPQPAAAAGQGQPAQPPAPLVPATCTVTRNSDYENQILALINQARADNGLGPLVMQSQVSDAAYGHSADMACNNYEGHGGSDGSTFYDRIKSQGFVYSYAAENIYYSPGSPEEAVTWWLGSPVHRANILNPNINSVGIGYAYNPNSTYGGYFTANFTRP